MARVTVASLQAEIAALRAQIATLTSAASPAPSAPSTQTETDHFVPTADKPFRPNYFMHLVGCAARNLSGNGTDADLAEIRRAMNEVRTKFSNADAVRLHSKVYAFAKNGSAQKPKSA